MGSHNSRIQPYTFQLGELKCSTHTIYQLVDEVRLLLQDRSLFPRKLLCVNAHIYNMAWSDPGLRELINSARIVAIDGMAIVMAARLAGHRVPARCNMTEAFRAFLKTDGFPATRGILLGATDEEVSRAAQYINETCGHCRIVSVGSGYLDDDDYARMLGAYSKLDFVFVGMGTPRTEHVSRLARTHCPRAIVWGVGGGTIQILAGTVKEAPVFFRRTGLQWLHRLCCEPARLWRRYLIGNPLFVFRILALALKARQICR